MIKIPSVSNPAPLRHRVKTLGNAATLTREERQAGSYNGAEIVLSSIKIYSSRL